MAIKITKADLSKNIYNDCKDYIVLKDDITVGVGKNAVILYDTCYDEVITSFYESGEKFDEYNDCISLRRFIASNNLEDIMIYMAEQAVEKFNIKFDIDVVHEKLVCESNYSVLNPANIPVKVVGGRKGKGAEGVIIYSYNIDNAYTGHREPRIVILDKNSGEFVTVNSLSYLEFDKNYVENYNRIIPEYISKTDDDFKTLVNLFEYGISDSSSSKERIKNIATKLATKPLKDNDKIIDKNLLNTVEKLRNKYIDKKNKEHDELRAEKLPGIIEWVKNNTDKKGDEIDKLAEHIFNKRNPIKY